MPPAPAPAQAAAATSVGTAFSTPAPAGLTPAQSTAYAGVQKAFAPTPAAPPTDTTGQKPSEPTVLTSDNITNNTIPKNNDALAQLQNKGTYIGHDGNTYYTDGTLAWSGQTGPEGAPGIDNPENDPEIAHINQSLGGLKALSDSATKQVIDSIHQMYGVRVAQRNDLNMRENQTTKGNLINAGTDRYAQDDSRSLMSAQEKVGVNAIASLEAQENQAIAKAQAAQQKGDQQAMDTALKQVQQIRTLKLNQANKLADRVQTQNDKLAATHQKSLLSGAIVEQYQKGTTAPADILKELQSQGYDLTAQDVEGAIKAITPTTKSTDTFKFSTSDTGRLLSAGLSPDQVQGLHDYYNGHGDATVLSSLSPEQQDMVHNVLNGTASKVAASQVPSYAQLHPKAPGSGGSKPYKSGSLYYTSSDLNTTRDWLDKTKGSDNYVDPDAYLKAAQAWRTDGGSTGDFLKNFPYASWVNPANTYVLPTINQLIKEDAAASKAPSTKGSSSSGRSI